MFGETARFSLRSGAGDPPHTSGAGLSDIWVHDEERPTSPRRPTRVAIVAAQSAQRADGIRDHTNLLEGHIAGAGVDVDVHLWCGRDGWLVTHGDARRRTRRSELHRGSYGAVIIQYNPFIYGRWGVAPWLPALIGSARMSAARPVMALMVHEPYVPMHDTRTTLMGIWQRAQLRSIAVSADVVFASIEAWEAMIRRWRPRRTVEHLPVASNLPDMRGSRSAARRALGADDDAIVIATFGTDHVSQLHEPVRQAVRSMSGIGRRVVVVELGARTPRWFGPGVAAVRSPGHQTAEDLARELSAADIFLAPFMDGVSTRRTTLMAALQHGLAVIGTRGHLTDGVLADATDALRLVPVDRPDLFAGAVVDLAHRPAERMRMGMAARNLYERRFDWPVLARRLLRALERT